MALANNLKLTADKMLEKFGNTLSIKTTTNDGVYNPQTGTRGTPTEIEIVRKGYIKNPSNEDLKISGLSEGTWGNIKFMVTLRYDNETSLIDNTYTINKVCVTKVITTTAQDTDIVLKIYCG